jgi:hypothetical protein
VGFLLMYLSWTGKQLVCSRRGIGGKGVLIFVTHERRRRQGCSGQLDERRGASDDI